MIDQIALEDLSYGMYIISTEFDEKYYGCVIDTVMQQNFTPAIISVSINKTNYTNEMIKKSGKFSISILGQDIKPDVIPTFGFNSSKDINKYENISYEVLESKNPVLVDNVVSYLDLKVIDKKELPDHTVFFAEVILAKKVLEKMPMTYAYYYDIIRKK